MAVIVRRRIPALVGLIVGALALVVPASPASAQAGGPGAQATPVVGLTDTALCPTAVGADLVAAGPVTVGAFTVDTASGACTSYSADAQGVYRVGGSGPLGFSADCQTSGLQHGGGVFVPEGTIINPGPGQTTVGAGGTTITTANTPVRYPNGTTATLNVVETTATTVTRTAIVSGGTRIGRVICGAADVYPLAVDTAEAAASAPELPISPAGDSGGISGTFLLLGGALAVAVIVQLAIGRKVWRRKADATG